MNQTDEIKIGLLTDLHYDGSAEATDRLREAVLELNNAEADMLVVMGDLIETDDAASAARLLHQVATLCSGFRGRIHYMPGNHDLDHLSKARFFKTLELPKESANWNDELNGFRLIGLDGNYSPDGTVYENGNFNWRESFLSEPQLASLAAKLDASTEPVILFSHQRLDLAGIHSVQNYAAVQAVIRASKKVLAIFQGHQHADDHRIVDGTNFYTLAAHRDGVGPTVAHIGPNGVRLVRIPEPLTPSIALFS